MIVAVLYDDAFLTRTMTFAEILHQKGEESRGEELAHALGRTAMPCIAIRAGFYAVEKEREMSLPRTLEAYLDEQGVKYVTLRHSAAYTAQELAAMLHVAGRELAKTVIIKVDTGFAMVVLPASRRISFPRLRETLAGKDVELVTEADFRDLFPNCEVGAMPPFGNLFHLPVYVDHSLTEDEEIVFNDGSFSTAVRMSYDDFARLVQPVVIDVSYQSR